MGTNTRRIVTTAAVGSLFAVAGVAAAAVDDSSTAVRTTPARIQYGSADAFEQRAVTIALDSEPGDGCSTGDFAGSADAFEQRCAPPAPTLDGSPDAIEHRLASDG